VKERREKLWRDDEGAAIERVARLEEENAQLREELARVIKPRHVETHATTMKAIAIAVVVVTSVVIFMVGFRSPPTLRPPVPSPPTMQPRPPAPRMLLDTPPVPSAIARRPLRTETAFVAPENVAYRMPATMQMANNVFVTSASLTDGSSVASAPDVATSLDVVIDLGPVARRVANVVIVWGPYGCSPAFPADDCNDGKRYIDEGSIEASVDGSTYVHVADIKDPHAVVSTYAVGRATEMPSKVRFVRVRAQGSAPFTVYEIGAYDTESAPTVKQLADLEIRTAVPRDQRWKTRLPPALNVALGKSTTSSSTCGRSSFGLTDGHDLTAACVPSSFKIEATVDLEQEEDVSVVRAYWGTYGCSSSAANDERDSCHDGHEYIEEWSLSASVDGMAFRPIATGGIPHTRETTVMVPAPLTKMRFVRVDASSTKNRIALYELSAFRK
jgi:hypothetical protein